MKRIHFIKQHDSMECGIACLQMICAYHGRKISLAYLSNICHATTEGVSLLGVRDAAAKMGFYAISGRLTIEELPASTLPCILHWNQNHFVVLYKVRKNKKFYIADPGKGLMTYNIDEFKSHWIETVSEYAKELTLTWYGGEPLLAYQVIEKILNRISSELSIKITRHSMITNGYMINDDVIRLFQKYPLDSMQITLDGTKERHNKLRSLKANHAPTYDRIIDNIDTVVSKLPNTELHVRVNIDKNNVNDFYQINEELKNKYKGKRIVVYPGIIRLENEGRTNLVEPAFGRWETAYLLFDLYNKGIIDGNIYPIHRIAKTCCALCVNSYIIGPTGEIYKCWNDVSDMSKVIGYINKPDIENKTLYYRYHEGCAWYNDSLCKSCFFLPICNGKCAWYNERNLYHGANYNLCQCLQKAPGLLNKCLAYFYESQMTKSE